MACPKCGSENIAFQREQVGSVGAHTNKVYVQPTKKSHGCLYWILIGWWWKLLFGRKRGGLGFHADKIKNRTVGICQDCGYTWKV